MTPYKAIVIQLGEVKDCTIVCECGAKVTIPLAKLSSLNNSKRCPGCSKEFDQSTIEVLKGLSAAYTHKPRSTFKIEFHIAREQ